MSLKGRRFPIVLACVGLLALTAHLASSFYYYWENRPRTDDLPFTANFEADPLSPWKRAGYIELCCAHSAHPTDERARDGRRSLVISLRWNDPPVAGNRRAEIRLHSAEFHRDYWYQFSLLLPVDWADEARPVTVAQWHGVRDQLLGEGGRAPPLRLIVANGKWLIVGGTDKKLITRFWFAKYTNEYLRTYWSAPIIRGQWEDWLFKINWSDEDDGELTAWRDGKLILQRTGANTYNDPLAPFFKLGLYIPSWKPLKVAPKIPAYRIYVDAVRVQTHPPLQPIIAKSQPTHRQ